MTQYLLVGRKHGLHLFTGTPNPRAFEAVDYYMIPERPEWIKKGHEYVKHRVFEMAGPARDSEGLPRVYRPVGAPRSWGVRLLAWFASVSGRTSEVRHWRPGDPPVL
jgi:hypothetical protein